MNALITTGTLKQQSREIGNSSGIAAPWQVLTTSNATFVAAPMTSTVPVGVLFPITVDPVMIEIERLDLQELKLDEHTTEQLGLFSVDQDLPRAMLNLLTYAVRPDEPSDQDVGTDIGYEIPR